MENHELMPHKLFIHQLNGHHHYELRVQSECLLLSREMWIYYHHATKLRYIDIMKWATREIYKYIIMRLIHLSAFDVNAMTHKINIKMIWGHIMM